MNDLIFGILIGVVIMFAALILVRAYYGRKRK